MKQIVLASNNKGKLAELQAMFAPLGLQLIAQAELNIPEAEEPFHTFVENALAKARHASRISGLPALADDAGLCVDAFNGLPGVQTAFYCTQFGFEKSDDNKSKAQCSSKSKRSSPAKFKSSSRQASMSSRAMTGYMLLLLLLLLLLVPLIAPTRLPAAGSS